VFALDMKAPEEPGRYVSYWRLKDDKGRPFGHRVWCDVIVAEPQNSSDGSLTSSSIIMPSGAPSVSRGAPSIATLSDHHGSVAGSATLAPTMATYDADGDADVITSSPTVSTSPSIVSEDDDLDLDTDSTSGLLSDLDSDDSDDWEDVPPVPTTRRTRARGSEAGGDYDHVYATSEAASE